MLEQAAQRNCGDLQNVPGCILARPTLGDAALKGEVALDNVWRSYPMPNIL